MKKLFIKLLYFSAPLILIIVLLEIGLRTVLPNDYKYKEEQLEQNASQINTLILGSSHAYFGLNPAHFSSKAFNAAHNLQSLYYDLAILKKYENQLTNLKTIIVPVSAFTLYSDVKKEDLQPFVKNYALYYQFEDFDFLKYYEVTNNSSPVNIKRLPLLFLSDDGGIGCVASGWGDITKWSLINNWDRAEDHLNFLAKTAQISSKRHNHDINSAVAKDYYTHNLSILDSLMDFCKEKNITVLFFTPPAYETYRNNINAPQLNATFSTMEKFVATHENCSYINLFSDKRFTATDFHDSDHVNKDGSKKLSEIIDAYVKNPPKANTLTAQSHL